MSSNNIGIGIIGCGLMGTIHAASYARTSGLRPVAFHNRSEEKARKLAEQHGGTACPSLDDLLAHPGVDAVCIASPQAAHHEQILAAAAAGKAIFCEKPVALTPAELRSAQAAVREAEIPFMTGHQMRLHPVILAVRQAMPRLGTIYQLDLEWCFRIEGHTGRCWESYRLGGFYMELGCHAADLTRFLLAPADVVHVSAHTLRIDPQRITEDCTNALYHFNSGAVARVLVSANHRTRRQGLCIGRVLGEKGRIDFSVYPYAREGNAATLVIDHGQEIFIPDTTESPLSFDTPPSTTDIYAGFYDIYDRQAVAFRESIANGTPPPCDLVDGCRAVELILAAYQQQGQASRQPNFPPAPDSYTADASCHPLIHAPGAPTQPSP